MQLERLAATTAYASELHEPLAVDELKQFARTTAINNKIPVGLFLSVAACESGWVADVQSHAYHNGKRENSWGIFQINLDAHGDEVTLAQAKDPYFNIQWSASKWDDAPHHWKVCYNRANASRE